MIIEQIEYTEIGPCDGIVVIQLQGLYVAVLCQRRVVIERVIDSHDVPEESVLGLYVHRSNEAILCLIQKACFARLLTCGQELIEIAETQIIPIAAILGLEFTANDVALFGQLKQVQLVDLRF